MDGIDSMKKNELIDLASTLGVDIAGTVAQMRYALKRYYEENPLDGPAKKKHRVDDGTTTADPQKCAFGAACPDLYSLHHRQLCIHDGFRSNPIKCRDGLACPLLKNKEHLVKYAHEDSLAKICPDGATCTLLHDMQHRLAHEHPGFRSNPVLCRDALSCPKLRDPAHLYKYAHDTGSSTAIPLTSATAVSPTAVPTAPAAPTPPSAVGPPPSLSEATEAVLTPIDKDSEDFWDLEEKVNANIQGRNEDYVEKRIKAGLKPIRFILVGADAVKNDVLEARFTAKRTELQNIREAKDVRERISFHGTHPKNLKSILKTGLLKFQHPLNPCKTQVDDGYFGSNKKGIYVSRYCDYTLKYANRVVAVQPGEEAKTIMFKTLPGKSHHCEKLVGPIDPMPGFDSHSSPTFLEWYLFDEAQCCPTHVLKLRAEEDTRTAADDQ